MEQVPSWWIKILDDRIKWHSNILKSNHPYMVYLIELRSLAS
jgi:hypothetical protein